MKVKRNVKNITARRW